MTTTTRSRAAGPGSASGRSAPYVRPRTDRTHPPTATGTATAPSDKVCSFQLPQVCSFRLPLTERSGYYRREASTLDYCSCKSPVNGSRKNSALLFG